MSAPLSKSAPLPPRTGVLNDILSPLTLSVVAAIVMFASLAAWFVAGELPAGMLIGMLIIALAVVIFMGTFAFNGEKQVMTHEAFKPQEIVDWMAEPAAIAAMDGVVVALNAAWRDVGGTMRRLPHHDDAPTLFVALREARQKGQGRALVRLGGFDYEMIVTAMNADMVLVRAASQGVLGNGLILDHETRRAEAIEGGDFLPIAAPNSGTDSGGAAGAETVSPAVLDAFASAAPFGAALVMGERLIESQIGEHNTAFSGLAGALTSENAVFGDVLTDATREELKARLDATKDSAAGPFDIHLRAHPERAVHLYISPVEGGHCVYLFDVSEQKKLEQTVVQSQKMQAIGQFAGGIAHDFNNLLTGFKFRNDQLLQNHPLGDPSYDDLNGIRQIIARAEDLVRNLLAFARKQTVKRVTLNAGEMVSEAEVLLRRLVREDVKLETEYGRNLPDVHVDKGQMEMVMMNLVVNARDAMKAQGGGTVRIRASFVPQADARFKGWAEAPEQGAAMIEVSDTGPGIPPEIVSQVFDPFFTTKPQGEGTGLGLSTVHGIINQAGGHILIDSAPGQGATFRIFLPVWVRPAHTEPEPVKAEAAKPVPKDLSGSGKILFVEDEQIVRGIAAKLLRQRGYEVLEACDGEEALMIIEEIDGKIDLLISDVIMPGLDGPSMLKKARPLIGNVPVMFISGYAESEFSDLLEEESGISFLPKPLDIKTLAERVKEQLSG